MERGWRGRGVGGDGLEAHEVQDEDWFVGRDGGREVRQGVVIEYSRGGRHIDIGLRLDFEWECLNKWMDTEFAVMIAKSAST